MPQYFFYLLFIFSQAGSLKQSKNEECDPKAFHVQIPFWQRINHFSPTCAAVICIKKPSRKPKTKYKTKLVIKEGVGEGSVSQRVHSFGFKMHAELRLGGLLKIQFEDCSVFSNYLLAMAVSMWDEGRCIRVNCLFLSSHCHKIVSLLEPVSYSADPVIAVWLNSDPVSFCLSCQKKHCHHGLSRTVWQYYMHLLGCHALALLILVLIALEVLSYSQLQE